MAVVAPNILPLAVAAERYGIGYADLRTLVHAGVFTKHTFGDGKTQPPIFVSVAELEGWKRAKVDGVREVQLRLRLEAERHHAELGGEAGGA
jgi:hypothetical protein